MDDIRQTAIARFRAYLERRQFSAHTVANYTLDLRLFLPTSLCPWPRSPFARSTSLWSASITMAGPGRRSTGGSMR